MHMDPTNFLTWPDPFDDKKTMQEIHLVRYDTFPIVLDLQSRWLRFKKYAFCMCILWVLALGMEWVRRSGFE